MPKPKVISPESALATLVCPSCEQETLCFNEDSGLFECNNESCSKAYALMEV